MPPYSAQSQSLFGNVGGPVKPTYMVDVPSAIDAATSGASSLIHSVYLRNIAQRQQQLDQQNKEEALRLRGEDIARETARDERSHAFEVSKANDAFAVAGGTRGAVTDVPTTGTTTGLPTVEGQSRIQAARGTIPQQQYMEPGAANLGAVSGSDTYQVANTTTAPAPAMSLTQPGLPERRKGPDTVDPTKTRGYLTTTDAAQIRSNALLEKSREETEARAKRQAGHDTFARETGKQLQELKGKQAMAKGAIQKVMTGNALAKASSEAAIGLIDHTDGSYDEAEKILNSDAGEQWRKAGVTPVMLHTARAKYVQAATKQAISLQGGTLPAEETPKGAAGRVRATRGEITGGAKSETPGHATEYSDDEVKAAYKAGKRTDADIEAFIKTQRGKPKK